MAETSPTDSGVTPALAQFAANLGYAGLPPEAVAQAKNAVLDTIGVALAGAAAGDAFKPAETYLTLHGGAGPASIWASGETLSPAAAAFLNTLHARVLDYDDIIEFPQVHVSVCVIPAALALAELRPVSGATLIAAIAAGSEIQSRLAAAIAPGVDSGRFPVMLATQQFGYFAAAAAAGRVIGLTQTQMEHAFGLAMMQAAGTEEMVVHARLSDGKSLYAGFSSQGGVQAALMAQCGVQAQGDAFTGKAGLFAAYYGNRYAPEALTENLGTRFVSLSRCIKAVPGTLVSHGFTEACLHIMAREALAPADLDTVILHVGSWGQAMCEPWALRRAPSGPAAAMNAIPFLVAKAIVNGKVALGDFTAEGLRQPEVLAMAQKITHRLDPRLNNPNGLEPGLVELGTKDGRTFRHRIDTPLGAPGRALGFAQTAAKFRANAEYAGLPQEKIQAIIAAAGRLDRLADARGLITALTGRSPA